MILFGIPQLFYSLIDLLLLVHVIFLKLTEVIRALKWAFQFPSLEVFCNPKQGFCAFHSRRMHPSCLRSTA